MITLSVTDRGCFSALEPPLVLNINSFPRIVHNRGFRPDPPALRTAVWTHEGERQARAAR